MKSQLSFVHLITLLFVMATIAACTPDVEPIEVTRVANETAVPPTLTPTPPALAHVTAAPTQVPPAETATATATTAVLPTPAPSLTPSPAPFTLGPARILGRGHIVDADFSADGRTLAVAWAGGISLVNVADAREIWWQSLDISLMALDMQDDGGAIAVALTDGRVIVINANGDRQSYAVSSDDNYLADIVWSPDNNEIAVQFLDPTNQGTSIYRLIVATGEVSEIPHSKVGTGVRPYLLWSPDGTLLPVAALGDACTHLVDVDTGEVRFELRGKDSCYGSHALAWSPDGRVLAVDSSQGTIDLLRVPNGDPVQSMTGSTLSFGPLSSGQPLFFSADGRWLASKGGAGFYSDKQPLTVWQVDIGGVIAQTDTIFEDRVSSAFMDDSLVTLHADGSLLRWDFADTGEEVLLGQLPVLIGEYEWRWSADGRYLAGRKSPAGLIVWDVTTGMTALVLEGELAAPAFSPDGGLLAVTDLAQSQLVLYDLATGQQQGMLPSATSQRLGTAFAPDGQHIAYGVDNTVMVVDLATGVETAVLPGYPVDQTIMYVQWSPDGTAILAASGKLNGDEAPGEIVLWQQMADGTWVEQFRVENIQAHYPGSASALFNPGGNLVAFESLPRAEATEFQIFVYDRQQEEVILTLPEYRLAAWQSDELLLTAEAQYWVYLTQWQVRTGTKVVGNASGDGGHQYSPDGVFFAQFSHSGRNVEVRDWALNQLVARGQVVRINLLWIGWSPDGRFLATYAPDGTITLWPLNWTQ